MLSNGFAAEDGALEVCVQNVVDGIFGCPGEEGGLGDAGAVDEDVDFGLFLEGV